MKCIICVPLIDWLLGGPGELYEYICPPPGVEGLLLKCSLHDPGLEYAGLEIGYEQLDCICVLLLPLLCGVSVLLELLDSVGEGSGGCNVSVGDTLLVLTVPACIGPQLSLTNGLRSMNVEDVTGLSSKTCFGLDVGRFPSDSILYEHCFIYFSLI